MYNHNLYENNNSNKFLESITISSSNTSTNYHIALDIALDIA